MKSKLRFSDVVLTKPKSSPAKATLTTDVLHELPELQHGEDEVFCLKWTI